MVYESPENAASETQNSKPLKARGKIFGKNACVRTQGERCRQLRCEVTAEGNERGLRQVATNLWTIVCVLMRQKPSSKNSSTLKCPVVFSKEAQKSRRARRVLWLLRPKMVDYIQIMQFRVVINHKVTCRWVTQALSAIDIL